LSSLTITLCSTPPTLSPYTTLFRSSAQVHHLPYMMIRMPGTTHENLETVRSFRFAIGGVRLPPIVRLLFANRGHYHRDRSIEGADRKSTRLNSSHGSISYAVFCLKK